MGIGPARTGRDPMTQAQNFIAEISASETTKGLNDLLKAVGAKRINRFEENTFWQMSDGSRVIISAPRLGKRLLRAAPAL